ncbi:MAG: hypothetical protein E7442_05815 [Ruminococcaceae bacterium]|nr:hypothetical protein [Oscillospiraceae bacterium]
MREKSRPLAYGALSVALTVVILYLGSMLPTARLALLCVSSLGVVLMTLRFDRRRALMVYAAAAALSLLVLPGKEVALAYTLLPGWYPLAKLRLERLRSPVPRFGGKLLLINVVLIPVLLLGKSYFDGMPLWQFLVSGNLLFLIYDHALTQIILLYMRKISGRI